MFLPVVSLYHQKDQSLILLTQLFLSFDHYACLRITSQYILDVSRLNNENLELLRK